MQAVVLNKKDFREFDQLTTLYTKDQGKIELLSRGIKKIVSKQAAYLLPFSLVEIEVVSGQEIDHLIRTQSVELFKHIRQGLKKSLMADYVVKLVDQVTSVGEKDERVFNLLVAWLQFIDQTESFNDSLLLSFCSKLLKYLGFEPIIDQCVIGGEKVDELPPQQPLYFSPSAGGVLCGICKARTQKQEITIPVTVSDLQEFSFLYSQGWSEVIQIKVSQTVKDVLYQFMRYQTERKISNWFEFDKTLA